MTKQPFRFLGCALALILSLLSSPLLAQIPGGGGNIIINSTPISNGTNGNCLYDNNGKVGEQACGSGTGTVTSVSVTTANGVSGSVANPTTTPAISLTLGAITPISSAVTATGSAASPAYAGGTSSNAGLYFSSTNWGLSNNGTVRFDCGITVGSQCVFAWPVNFSNNTVAGAFSYSANSQFQAPGYVGKGSPPVATGSCPITTQLGGNTVGSFVVNGACIGGTVILTFSVTGITNGWVCDAHDQTTVADLINQTATSPTTATFTGTMANSDVVNFKCMAY